MEFCGLEVNQSRKGETRLPSPFSSFFFCKTYSQKYTTSQDTCASRQLKEKSHL